MISMLHILTIAGNSWLRHKVHAVRKVYLTTTRLYSQEVEDRHRISIPMENTVVQSSVTSFSISDDRRQGTVLERMAKQSTVNTCTYIIPENYL